MEPATRLSAGGPAGRQPAASPVQMLGLQRNRTAALAAAAVVLSAIPFTPPTDAIAEAGRLTLRAVLESGLLLAGVCLAAFRVRGHWRELPWSSTAAMLVTLLCGWAIVSARWSPSPSLTVAKSLELWLMLVAAALLAPSAHDSRHLLARRLAAALLFVLAVLVIANLFMWRNPLPVVPWETLVSAGRLSRSDEVDLMRPRLMLAYGHPLLTSDLVALAALGLVAARPRKRVLILVLPILALMMWLEDARGPLLGVVVGVISLVACQIRDGRQRATFLACAVVLGLAVAAFHPRTNDSARDSTEEVQTLNGRTELWLESISLFEERPLRGWGYFGTRFPLLQSFDWAGNTHNWALELLLGLGLPGFTLGLILVIQAFRLVRRDGGFLLAVTLYGLIHGMLDPVLFVPGPAMFVWLCALMAVSGDRDAVSRAVAPLPTSSAAPVRYRRLAPAR